MKLKDIIEKTETKSYKNDLELIEDLITYYAVNYKSTIRYLIENFYKNKVKVDALTALMLKDVYEFLTGENTYLNIGKYNFFTGDEVSNTLLNINYIKPTVIKPVSTAKVDEFILLVRSLNTTMEELILFFKLIDDVKEKYVND